MNKRAYSEKAIRTELIVGTMAVLLLLGTGTALGKKGGKIQLKKDGPDSQEQVETKTFSHVDLFRDMLGLQREMDRLFGSALNPYSGFPELNSVWEEDIGLPSMDLREQPDAYVVHMDLPGMSKADISIEVKDNVLSVAAERKASTEKKDGEKVLIQERSLSSVSRNVVLQKPVNADQVTAEYKDGVLHITLPKTETDRPAKKIEIK
ncbi:Hsp20/alpha crystallin family protein [Pontiellaceae bacterium B12219]|nr:Hsp20/alpha crystallin family protein [Pontiellaceae bacterium B12219]